MLKIHEFAHLGHVSGKMLRHYDALGLLQPRYIDESTGYRYYVLEQLPRLNRILALKDLGFRLEQIGELVDQEFSLEQLRAMFILKQAEVQQFVAAEQARLTRIAARLKLLETAGAALTPEVILTAVPAITIASLHGDIDADADAAARINELFAELLSVVRRTDKHPSRQRLLIWRSLDNNPEWSQLPIELAVPITSPIATSARLQMRDLPAVPLMATTIHHGTYAEMNGTMQSLFCWVENNGFRVSGEVREWYLQRGTDMANPDYLTEIQLPLEQC